MKPYKKAFWVAGNEALLTLCVSISKEASSPCLIITTQELVKKYSSLKSDLIEVVSQKEVSQIELPRELYCLTKEDSEKVEEIRKMNFHKIFFYHNDIPKQKRILSEFEVYFLSQMHCELNALSTAQIIKGHLKFQDSLTRKTKRDCVEKVSVSLPELSSNNELYFWLKIIDDISSLYETEVIIPQDLVPLFQDLQKKKNIYLVNHSSVHSHSKFYISKLCPFNHLEVQNRSGIILHEEELSKSDLIINPNIQYLKTTYSFKDYQTTKVNIFKLIRGEENQSKHNQLTTFDENLQMWSSLNLDKGESIQSSKELFQVCFQSLWRFYLFEKQVENCPISLSTQIDNKVLSSIADILIKVFNLMGHLESFSENQEMDAKNFEHYLSEVHSLFLTLAEQAPYLEPLYWQFHYTKTLPDHLSLSDIKHYYLIKSQEMKIFTQTLYEMIIGIAKDNRREIHL